VSEKWPTLRRGDTWCAYGRWKTAAEVPRHILPPPKKPPPFSLFSGSGGGGSGAHDTTTTSITATVMAAWAAQAAAQAEAAAAAMDADVAASLPLFDTRALTLEEGAPLECRRPPSGTKHHPRRAGNATNAAAAAADVKGCDALSGVGDPAVAQETATTRAMANGRDRGGGGGGTGGGGGGGGGMIHALYVKDGTSLVHVVIDPEAIN
jgi:hypothetical protein